MQIVELAAKLQSVGFTNKQAKVYVAALFLGPSAVQKIAEQAEINRATAYVILGELAKMGLVSESTQGKKTVFVAEPPTSIDRYLDDQSKALVSKKDELKNLLPGLNEMSRSTDGAEVPVVRFYKGKKGIAQTNAESRRKAKAGDEVYGVTNVDEVEAIFPGHFDENAVLRVRKKLSSKTLYYSTSQSLPSSKKILRKTKRIKTPVMADITLYPNRATLVTYAGEDSTGIVIENKQIVETLRVVFELAWQNYQE